MPLCRWTQAFGLLVAAMLMLSPAAAAYAAEGGLKAHKLAQLTFCVPPQVWSKKRKRCVNPFVKARVKCKAPRIWSAKQKRCVFPVVDNPRCGRREVFSEAKDACVCREGYERSGKKCVRAAQATNPGPDLAEVQACLNALGYRAGAVDGRPGQRTRGAWNDFREDKGLGGPLRTFNDPKTLEALFNACDAKSADQAEAPDAEAKPEAESEAATEAVAGTYPEVLCVSKSLYKQISKLVGKKAKLEVCGEACVPIPPGTPEAQLKKSEQEYSVTWCRNCIQIGKSGLVCGQSQ